MGEVFEKIDKREFRVDVKTVFNTQAVFDQVS